MFPVGPIERAGDDGLASCANGNLLMDHLHNLPAAAAPPLDGQHGARPRPAAECAGAYGSVAHMKYLFWEVEDRQLLVSRNGC
jgi:hypothetical protein